MIGCGCLFVRWCGGGVCCWLCTYLVAHSAMMLCGLVCVCVVGRFIRMTVLLVAAARATMLVMIVGFGWASVASEIGICGMPMSSYCMVVCCSTVFCMYLSFVQMVASFAVGVCSWCLGGSEKVGVLSSVFWMWIVVLSTFMW